MNEDRLRLILHQEAESVSALPRFRQRIDERRCRAGSFRARALAVSVAAIVLAAGVLFWFITNGRTVGHMVGDRTAEYFAGFWPAHTLTDAATMQRRADSGQQLGLQDPAMTAFDYMKGVVGLPSVAHDSKVTGSASRGWTADVTVTTMPNQLPVHEHVVHLIGLKGTRNPVWFVAGLESPNLKVNEPRSGSAIQTPMTFRGKPGADFRTSITVTITDDARNALGQSRVDSTLPAVFLPGRTPSERFGGSINFSTSSTSAGIVTFEAGNGPRGNATDVTVVRVRFADDGSSGSAAPESSAISVPADADPSAYAAVLCFTHARVARDLASARPCMTTSLADAYKDPIDFMGPSSPNITRFTITSETPTPDVLSIGAREYIASSDGLDAYSDDSITVIRNQRGWLVSEWHRGTETSVTSATTVTAYLAPKGTLCKELVGEIGPGAYLPAERAVAVGDDLPLRAVQELVMGPQNESYSVDDESRLAAVFPIEARVNSVRIAGCVARVDLSGAATRSRDCPWSVGHTALVKTLERFPGVRDVLITIGGRPEPTRG